VYGRLVRRSATLGAWSRRQTVLAGCLAAAAALAGLSVPFGVPWLAAAGAIVAAAGGLASLVIIAARVDLLAPRQDPWPADFLNRAANADRFDD